MVSHVSFVAQRVSLLQSIDAVPALSVGLNAGLGGLLLCWLLAVVSAQQPTKVTDVAVRVISTSVLTSYVWRASVTANRQLARIPVGSNKGFATVK